jgi:hypothetical protein
MKKIVFLMFVCGVLPCVGMIESYNESSGKEYESYTSEEYSSSPQPERRKRKKRHRKTRSRNNKEVIENFRDSIGTLNFNTFNNIESSESYDLESGDGTYQMLSDDFLAELAQVNAYNNLDTDAKVYKNLLEGIKKRRKNKDNTLSEIERLLKYNMRKGRLKTAKQIYTARELSTRDSESSGKKLSQKDRDQLITDYFSRMGHDIHEEKTHTLEREGSRNAILAGIFGLLSTGMTGVLTYLASQTSADPATLQSAAECLTCLLSTEVIDGVVTLSSTCLQTCITGLG